MKVWATSLRWLDYSGSASPLVRARFWRETALAYLFLLPGLVILGPFHLYPVLHSATLSLYKWDFISPVKTFVGLGNYKELLADPGFWNALSKTAVYVVATVPSGIALSLGVALLLNRALAGRALYRLAYFLPYVATVVAVAMVWNWIYHEQWGLLNFVLGKLGLPPQKWVTSPDRAMFALVVMSIWKSLGYNIVIFLAGLQNIDKELQAAAQVDGAVGWRLFRHITWPLLSPTTFFVSILSTIHAFKVFTEVFVLFGGRPGPMESTQTIVFYIYQQAFLQWRMGYAAAAAYVLFIVILLFTLLQLWYGKRRVHHA